MTTINNHRNQAGKYSKVCMEARAHTPLNGHDRTDRKVILMQLDNFELKR